MIVGRFVRVNIIYAFISEFIYTIVYKSRAHFFPRGRRSYKIILDRLRRVIAKLFVRLYRRKSIGRTSRIINRYTSLAQQ